MTSLMDNPEVADEVGVLTTLGFQHTVEPADDLLLLHRFPRGVVDTVLVREGGAELRRCEYEQWTQAGRDALPLRAFAGPLAQAVAKVRRWEASTCR